MNEGRSYSEIFPVHPALFSWLCAPPRPPPLKFRALVEVAEKERNFMLKHASKSGENPYFLLK